MAKKLTENVNSLYIGAANSLRPKSARKRIVAYVESYDDVSFWSHILSDFNTDKYYFQVMLPSNTSLAKGKKVAMMNDLGQGLGCNMIACVDSDYDYLLQGRTNTSRRIIRSPYVLHTYAYAIENYQCYAESLHEACVMATLNDHPLVDFVSFMTMYSQIAYPLFIWSVWFYRQRNLNDFSLFDFCSFVRLDKVSVRHPEECLIAMDKRVKNKLRELEKRHSHALGEIEAMKAEFTYLGVTPENTYLFIQGHHIMESVAMKILTPVCNALRREREEEIKRLAEHHTQFRNELTCYERSLLPVDVVLRKQVGFKDSPVFKRLEKDIREFLKRIK